MRPARTNSQGIFIASDIAGDADVVKGLLAAEFDNVIISADPDNSVADFYQCRPDLLILAFKDLEESERYCLNLYRHGDSAPRHPHCVIALCRVEDVNQAYLLCREGVFDDYVLFWPNAQDSRRLLMAAHLALKWMVVQSKNAPLSLEFSEQIRELTSLGNILNQKIAQGDTHVETIGRNVTQANTNTLAAFEHLSKKLTGGELPGLADKKSMEVMQNELGQLKRKSVDSGYKDIAASVQPLKKWVGEMREVAEPHLDAIHSLNTLMDKARPSILVVDDDEFQFKIIGKILSELPYQILYAGSGAKALELLDKVTPELILMDVMMPGMSGIEAVRQIRLERRLARIPIIMVTGDSEKDVVKECLQAGANGFVVKPVERNMLLEKISQALGVAPR
jgi:CheY-like chemotaxis protein